jgi:hypothetical protein
MKISNLHPLAEVDGSPGYIKKIDLVFQLDSFKHKTNLIQIHGKVC